MLLAAHHRGPTADDLPHSCALFAQARSSGDWNFRHPLVRDGDPLHFLALPKSGGCCLRAATWYCPSHCRRGGSSWSSPRVADFAKVRAGEEKSSGMCRARCSDGYSSLVRWLDGYSSQACCPDDCLRQVHCLDDCLSKACCASAYSAVWPHADSCCSQGHCPGVRNSTFRCLRWSRAFG